MHTEIHYNLVHPCILLRYNICSACTKECCYNIIHVHRATHIYGWLRIPHFSLYLNIKNDVSTVHKQRDVQFMYNSRYSSVY